MKYKQYQKMKDSGVEWIGEIPEHWEKFRLKFLLASIESGNRESGDKLLAGIPSIGGEHITWNGNMEFNSSHFISEEYFEKRKSGKIQENDVLLVKDGATIGKIAFVHDMQFEKASVNEHVFILRSNEMIDSEFLFYYFFSGIGQFQIKREIRGAAQGGLNSEFISKCIVVLPQSKEEQQNLVLYIRREKKNFDNLISKSQSQVNSLQEKRLVLITNAVTKGLDPTVPMKDSGIEWIGEIPEHWEVNKIKFTSYVKGRIGYHGLRADEFIDEGPYLITGTDFKDGGINWDTCYHVPEWRYDQNPFIQIKNNDILVTKDGTIGKIAFIEELPGKTTLNSHLLVLRPLKNLYHSRYMYWIFLADYFTRYVNLVQSGSIMNAISQDKIENFVFALPPKTEQQQIYEFLDKETAQLDDIISKSQSQVNFLQEKRQALITAVVTGKIDVRNGVAA